MRLFPRTARRRLTAAVAAVVVVVGALAVPLANAEDLKSRQQRVQKQLKSAGHELDESSSALRAASARLSAAQAQLDDARDELASVKVRLHAARLRDERMREKLAQAEARLATAEADLAGGREDLEVQREAVTDVVTEIYQGGDPQLIAFASMLNAESSSDLTRRDEIQDVIVDRETSAYDDLRAAEVLLEVREQQVSVARDEVEQQRKAAAEHLLLMQDLTAQAKAAKVRVAGLVVDRRDARAEASRARAHDQAELAKLKREEAHIKSLIQAAARRAAARAARNNGGYSGNTGGLFGYPVLNTYITSPYGYREHPIYHYWGLHNGTDFHAPCGTPLRAIGGGRVISQYYSSVYGNRLYVGLGMYNGKYLTAVYNHATRYTVGVGDTVSRGQVLGYAGTTGWSTACHLHFTILAGGQTVNPMNYL